VPELPEVETVRIGLNGVTCDRPILKVEVLLNRMIAYPQQLEAFQQGLQGASILKWSRRGKYLLATLGRHDLGSQTASDPEPPLAGWLGVHLRMSGQLLWVDEAEPLHKHTRVRLYFKDHQELRFIDQRTFGQMWWIPPDQDPNQLMPGMGSLGPEPLSQAFSQAYLTQICKGRDRPIKNALLDQSLIAGLGNIYVDESLFLGGLHPTQTCRSLKPRQIQRLHRAIETVIRNALTQGGTTFSDFRQVSGVNGNYGLVAWVYRRAGEPCRQCQTPIEKIRLAGRSCHFCPQCQQRLV
jgi:formamidopyrimidine-DNA glycosylase